MTLSHDSTCCYLALKTLALLARSEVDKNRQLMLQAGMLPRFVEHMRSSDVRAAREALKVGTYAELLSFSKLLII